MDDDDDFYGATESTAPQNEHTQRQSPSDGRPQEGDGMNMDDDAEEDEEDEDDDDDFNIITEAPTDAAPADISHPRHATLRNESQRPPSRDSSAATAAAKSITPSATPRGDIPTPVTTAAKPAIAHQKPGSAYPPVHVSTIDVNANPTLPATGKPILSTDMDADFPSEDDKPWRRPGSDVTDYFNYGFDEFTWASYCIKQQELRKEVGDQKKQLEDMQAFMTMGMPPMPGAPQPVLGGPPPTAAPPGMPGMPGMPDMSPDMMQGMLASMMAQGLDPSAMDPMSFMQHAQAMMGGQPGGGGGPPPGQAGYGGQPQGQGFGGQVPGQGHMGYGGGYDQRSGYGGGGGGGRGRGQRRW